MKQKNTRFAVSLTALLVLAVITLAVLSFVSPMLFWPMLLVWLTVILALSVFEIVYRRQMFRRMRAVVKHLDPSSRETLSAVPVPLVLVGADGTLQYYNPLFEQMVLDGNAVPFGESIERLFGGVTVEQFLNRTSLDILCGEKKLSIFISRIDGENDSNDYLLYIFDVTVLKNIAAEYTASRPVMLYLCIDNLEEATRDLRDGDRARIVGQTETILEDWMRSFNGILQKVGTGRFFAITENRHLNTMTKNRFAVLDTVRKAFPETDGGITMSVGVGQGKTIEECSVMAKQALEMALSRGGDQVALKTVNGYDFYGGQSKGVERRTKVRTRMVANSLRDLITSSDLVLIMGHRQSDLDCLGSGAALAVIARHLGAKAHVVVRPYATMAGQIIRRYEEAGYTDLFIDPDDATERIGKNMLLIVTDTHSVPMLDAPDIYDLAERVVVIDHHRRMVNYIQDAVLTFHEPSSSSACELVTELLPYMMTERAGRAEAEALLSGIMLDTRNFVMRTGVRTFEAAAYLRGLGADTVSVKKMFAESLDMYQLKNDLVAQAELYRGTAITATEENLSDRRAAAAQAADDLLSVQGVRASFVLCPMGREINISARSFGEINVQLIMEALGGGGHQTMAATQLKDCTVEEAKKCLKEAIVAYLQENDN